MIKLTRKVLPIIHPDEIKDVQRIVALCAANGYEITPETAYDVWKEHSESYCAAFLRLPENDNQLLSIVLCSPIIDTKS